MERVAAGWVMTKVRIAVQLSALVIAIASGPLACGSSNPAGSDASWAQIGEKTACEAMNPRECRGAYVVGPADGGTRIEGSISDAERARLSEDVAQVAGRLGGSPQCDSPGGVPGVGDEVDLTDGRGVVWKVYELTLEGTCYRGTRDAATRLHDDLQELIASYYPRPFPR